MHSRRSARLRREYLKVKRVEDLQNELNAQRKLIVDSHDNETPLPNTLKKLEKQIRDQLDFEDVNSTNLKTPGLDSEYRLAGIRNPKIIITTGRSSSSPTMKFAKELSLLLPNSHRVNRGNLAAPDLLKMAVTNEITDVIIVGGSTKKGYPTSLTISHLPHGPTAIFELRDVVLRHDLETKAPPMPTHYPNLIFEGLDSKIGNRFKHILKYIFPASNPIGEGDELERCRVVSFINKRDLIYFRHQLYEPVQKLTEEEMNAISSAQAKGTEKELAALEFVKLNELGPRFTMKPFRIIRGTFDMKDCETEWTAASFLNRPAPILQDMGSK